MVSPSRFLPLVILGLLLPLSACVSTPRTQAARVPSTLQYCDPYAINSSAVGGCYSGINRYGYGGYYGAYGYPQAYGAASSIYGAYGFNRGRGGYGSYYFDNGYHFTNAYRHGHGNLGYVPVSYSHLGPSGHLGQGGGHFGGHGGLHSGGVAHAGAVRHVGSPRHTSGVRHGGNGGHSRSSHGSRRH
ncbi:MAG: hypothetical protein EPN60_09875 [Nevskiaceae bacterium]|nr:hypothetical protein [Stagnimonas sp.]TAM26563.1 MAG: hypothetical protein EPN60_09875 [Nevskiaceae bacterium]